MTRPCVTISIPFYSPSCSIALVLECVRTILTVLGDRGVLEVAWQYQGWRETSRFEEVKLSAKPTHKLAGADEVAAVSASVLLTFGVPPTPPLTRKVLSSPTVWTSLHVHNTFLAE